MSFNEKDYTTNIEIMRTALTKIAEGLANIISIGYYRPSWTYNVVVRRMEYKRTKKLDRKIQ